MAMKKVIFFLSKKIKSSKSRGLFKNPLFYCGIISPILLGVICFGSNSFAGFNNSSLRSSDIVFFNTFFNKYSDSEKNNPFMTTNNQLALESPDLKIVEDNCLCAVSPHSIVSTKVLGAIFGETVQNTKEIQEYVVQPGDTIASIAQSFEITPDTILWVNDLTKSSTIKVGQSLVILPITGLLHIVKQGDIIGDIAKKYKVKVDDVVAFNSLSNEGDIFIGDILVVPGGIMPQKAVPLISGQTQLADNFFIFPTQGTITQGSHFFNAVDVANKCGTPIYAAAGGVVQRVRYGWNYGGGNNITILHSNGVVTYYGHIMSSFVIPGQRIDVGDRVALMGGGVGMAGAGISTGCHTHFEVIGAKNPLSKYLLGTKIKY